MAKGENGLKISGAKDATREFFRVLFRGIRKSLDREGLSTNVKLAITVPASFGSNQRSDLMNCFSELGITDYYLIDEPNAAFLSFLHSVNDEQENAGFLNNLKRENKNIIVYDIGAALVMYRFWKYPTTTV